MRSIDVDTVVMGNICRVSVSYTHLDVYKRQHFDEMDKIMNKGFNKLKNALDKPDEKREEDRYQLKESTEVELTQVSGNNVFDDSEEIINQMCIRDRNFTS